MNAVQAIVVAGLSCLVIACGGGGGGGGGDSGDKQIDDSFKLRTYAPIVYAGNEADATLVQTNFPRYVANFYQITQLVVSNTVEALVGTFFDPYFLALDEGDDTSGGEDEEVCQSGTFDVDDKTNAETGLGRLVVQFTNCVMDDVRIDGQIVYDITAMGSLPRAATTSIDQLTVEVDNERFVLQGDFDLEFDQSYGYVLQGQAIMTSALQNRQFKLDKLVISKADARAAVDAEFWDSVDGKVIIKSEMDESRLTFAGNNDTLGVLDFDFDDPMSGYVIESFKLALINAAQSQFELIGDFQPDAILEWPHTPNRQPFAVSSVPVSVDRNALLTLNAAEYVSDHDDLLIYSFRITRAPAVGCGHEIDQQDVRTVDLVFNCQGDYVLEIGARDGTTAPFALPLTVHVIPLPAEFESVGEVTIEKDTELNVPLSITNEALDGPFAFSIAHAPKGVTVSSQGVVTGIPELLLYENNSNIMVEAVAYNGRQSSVEFDVDVSDDSVQLDVTPLNVECENQRWGVTSQSGNVAYVCKWGNSYLLYELVSGQRRLAHVGRNFSENSRLQSLELQDFDNDNRPELIMVYEDSIHVVSPEIDQEVGVASLAGFSGLSSFESSKVYPADVSFNGFVLQLGTRFFRYSMLSNSVTSTFETGVLTATAIGNIDADAEPEFLMDDGRLYGFGSTARNLVGLVGTKKVFLANVTGSAAAELVIVDGDQECSFPSDIVMSVYNATTLARISQSSIQNPLGAQVPWCPILRFMNAGSGVFADLYLIYSFTNQFHRYVYTDGTFSLVRTFDVLIERLGYLDLVGNQLASIQSNTAELMNVDNGSVQTFSFLQDSKLQSGFGPAWDGSRIFANYSTSIPRIYSLGYVEFDGNDGLELGMIEPELGVLAKDIMTSQQHQALDGGLVSISRNVANSTIRLDSIPSGETIGQFIGSRSAVENARWTISDFDGDHEYDAFRCGFAGADSALAWLKLNETSVTWQSNISAYGVPANCEAAELVGRTFGGTQRLAALFSFVSGGALLVVYDYSGNNIVEVARYPIETTGSDEYFLSVLDVTGDNLDEIVVYRGGYGSRPLSKFWIIHTETGDVQVLDVAVSEPVIQKNRPAGNRNLLVAGTYGSLQDESRNFRKLYSKLYEVSSSDGAIVWQSNLLIGTLTEYGYYNLDAANVGEKVIVATSKALYFYH